MTVIGPSKTDVRGAELELAAVPRFLEVEAVGRKRILFISRPVYNQKISFMVANHFLVDEDLNGIMLNLRCPYTYAYDLFKKKGLPTDKLTFIDAITTISGEPPDHRAKCVFLSCPFSNKFHVELAKAFTDAKDSKFLLVDDFTALLNYFSEDGFADFTEKFSVLVRDMGDIPVIILADQSRDIIMLEWLSSICDLIVSVKGHTNDDSCHWSDYTQLNVVVD